MSLTDTDRLTSLAGHGPRGNSFSGQSWGNNPEDHDLHKKTGIRVFLAVVSSLFFLFFVAFLIRSQLSDWEHLSAPFKPLENPLQLSLNTGFLFIASIFLQWSRVSSKQKETAGRNYQQIFRTTINTLILAGVFTILFLAGQINVWNELNSLGYYVNSNPANSFFYLLTGLHGLHLVGGLFVWVRIIYRSWRGSSMKQISSSIDLCVIYWHYLLCLWLVLYFLLTSSPKTFGVLARLCGF